MYRKYLLAPMICIEIPKKYIFALRLCIKSIYFPIRNI